jgi:hypothetical protein
MLQVNRQHGSKDQAKQFGNQVLWYKEKPVDLPQWYRVLCMEINPPGPTLKRADDGTVFQSHK